MGKLKLYKNIIKRKILWNLLAEKLDLILITEYPKSGGTWFSQMIADATQLPFSRNLNTPKFQRSVLNGHEWPRLYSKNVLTIVRDGRDVMVSFYYHSLFNNEHNSAHRVEEFRKKLNFPDLYDIRKNLPRFIEYISTEWIAHINHYKWSDFVLEANDKLGEKRVFKYEDLLSNPNGELERALKLIDFDYTLEKINKSVDKNSFNKITKRKSGKEKIGSFARKGIAGDWRNHFDREAAEVFNHFHGDALIKLGYEKNEQWIKI